MKTRGSKIEAGGWPARSVLDCGSPPRLSILAQCPHPRQSARGLAQSKTWRRFVASLVFLAAAIIAHAQSYSVEWYKMPGGGGIIVRSVGPRRGRIVLESQPGFMDQSGRLQSLTCRLGRQTPRSQPAEFLIDLGQQLCRRLRTVRRWWSGGLVVHGQ
jgi:hypothetical protein